MKTPYPRSYWVAPGRLLAGYYPGARKPAEALANLRSLAEAGITRIINLMESGETNQFGQTFAPYDSLWRELASNSDFESPKPRTFVRHPIRDMDVPSIEDMRRILDEIDSGLSQGENLYVHCWGGKGRTGTVIGCWLARHGKPQPLQALRDLVEPARDQFGEVPQTNAQRNFVSQWME